MKVKGPIFLVLTYLGSVYWFSQAHKEQFETITSAIFYMGVFALSFSILLGLGWLFRQELIAWRKALAEARQAENEANVAGVVSVVVPNNSTLFTRDLDPHATWTNRSMYPKVFQNGQWIEPTPTELNLWYQMNVQHNQMILGSGGPVIEPLEDQSFKDDRDWLREVAETAAHIHVSGFTGSGKTVLGNYLLGLMKDDPKSKIFLINPKHIASSPTWGIRPVATNLEQSLITLQKLALFVEKRANDPSFNPATSETYIFVVDEWDWLYETYGLKAVSPLRIITKVGRELKIRVLLVGQSAIKEETGLGPSSYGNMCRIALGNSARKLCSTNQLPVTRAERVELNNQLGALMQEGKRAVVVAPILDLPMVRVIPEIASHALSAVSSVSEQRTWEVLPPALTAAQEFDRQCAEGWGQGRSLRAIGRAIHGEGRALGSRDLEPIKESLIRQKLVSHDYDWTSRS